MKKYSKLVLVFHFLLFTLLCNAQYDVLLSFNGANGAYPGARLTLSGNILYGMTSGGGANNVGVIFSIHIDGSGYKELLDFDGTNGSYPIGSLLLSGNMLYGMTSGPNIGNDYGNIFSIDTNGNNYKNLLNFNIANGREPAGSLTLLGNVLYGMTYMGGANGIGVIFSIDTSGGGYRDLLDFNGVNGGEPYGNLTLSEGKLYGMTCYGGVNGRGVVFSIDTDGGGYRDLFNFNGINGDEPFGSLTFSEGKLYGMTSGSGGSLADSVGNIFSIDTNGRNYKVLLDFNEEDGAEPFGTLIYSSGLLFGMTQYGGTYNDGVIFSIDTNGSGYANLFDFHGIDGSLPGESLLLSGNVLYGMASDSGAHYNGVIFSLKDTNGRLGVSNLDGNKGSIIVYPNPNNGTFSLSLSNVNSACNIEIYNILGEKVFTETLPQNQSNNTISLISQPSGLYFYRVIEESGNLVGNGKLVIEK